MTKALTKIPYSVLAFLLAVLMVAGAGLLSLPHTAHSQIAGTPITGYAWSDNIGWVSLNCATDPTGCSTAADNWGLSADGNGNITGYAWSDNIGWISANDPDGTHPAPQTINRTMTGWLKALSADNNGWDGWISLSGTSPSYGVTASSTNACAFTGDAWGSDVVGWVDFSQALMATSTPDVYTCFNSTTINKKHTNADCTVTNTPTSCPTNAFCVSGSRVCQYPPTGPSSATGNLKVDPTIVSSGATTTVSWSIQNVQSSVTNPQGCSVTGSNRDAWNGTLNSNISSGSYSSGKIVQQTTYTLTCTPLDPSQTFSQTAVVNIAPAYQER